MCFAQGSLLLALGCVSTDAHGERQRATALASETVGVPAAALDPWSRGSARLDALLSGGLTEAAAVEIALHCNPTVLGALLRIDAAKADAAQARLLPNPIFSGSLLFPTISGPEKKTFLAVLPIAELWSMAAAADSADALLESEVVAAAQAAAEVAARTRVAYRRVAGWIRAREVVRERVAVAGRDVAVAQRRVDAGDLSELDGISARTPAIDAQRLLIEADRELELARAELRYSVGLPNDPRAAEVRESSPHVEVDEEVPDLAALTLLARDRRLDARVAALRWDAACEAIEREEARSWRTLRVGFSWERLVQTLRGLYAMLELPLFDQNQAQIALAQARAEEARWERERVIQQISLDVASARARLVAARRATRYLNGVALPQSDEVLAGFARRLDSGDDALDGWLLAARTAVERRREYALALVEAAVAEAELLRALGGVAALPSRSSSTTPEDPSMDDPSGTGDVEGSRGSTITPEHSSTDDGAR